MLFSVIIPTFNRVELLRDTLNSVRQQNFGDHEIIVVDDGSSDETGEYLHTLAPTIRSLRQENRGPGAARNLGAANATGEYLAFLDSDDLWFPWTLRTYCEAVRRHSSPAFIAGAPFRFTTETELECPCEAELRTKYFADYLASGDTWRWWGVSSFVVRKDMLHSVGGFTEDDINGEDADFALRLGTAPGFVQLLAPVTFGYREHAASLMKQDAKTVAGAWYKIHAEQEGRYPGGSMRARERWRILTRHIRPVSLTCLCRGMRREAWKLYRDTLYWHLRLGRWKYLLGFPLKAVRS